MTANDVAAAITPAPVRIEPGSGVVNLERVRMIVPDVVPGTDDAAGPGLHALAAELLEPAGLTLVEAPQAGPPAGTPLELRVDPSAGPEASSNPERYTLSVTPDGVVVGAPERSGLLHGLRSLRQLADAAQAAGRPGEVATVVVHDEPRYAWRGLSLDIARHFFGPADLRAVVDLIARYKMNRLGLHLTDDQGWRLEIPSRPELVTRSSAGAVNGDPGGYLGVDDYADLQEYAAARGIVVVPEIDLPGHVNAATHAYGELTPDGRPTDTYEGIDVGFSRLHLDLPATEPFLRDVLGDVARMTHGEWVHFGGDEVHRMETTEYLGFVELCQEIVTASGKTPAAWQEAAGAGHGDAGVAAAALAAATVGAAAAGTPAGSAAGTATTASAAGASATGRSAAVPAGTTPAPGPGTGSPVHPGTVLHYWDTRAEADAFVRAAEAGGRFVMAPASRTYLDMKYTPEHPLGLDWAGCVELRDSYEWDPDAMIQGLPAEAVDGVSACVWTETLVTRDHLFSMLLPRLAAVAEAAWTPQEGKDWQVFRRRIAVEAGAWRRDGAAYHPTPQVEW
ncbi:family 20 glycosylhydrolase [Myceligenerans indicum]|uniref:beta-N-acetylhexosaminidase n=1 Tax=Myceligenerans indicum TaxID=2593663 RepID=A0ABS1LI92_9MICO|nr:family 20 glycosylhydrolase [Myceligenerans indicum]MBL0885543.1 family 20 glycosylhydrolase [Myceligenerans indicum]